MVRRTKRLPFQRWPILAILAGLLVMAAGGLWLVQHRAQPKPVAALPAPILDPSATPSRSPAGFPTGLRIRVRELSIDLEVVPGDGVNAPLFRAATLPSLKLPGQGGRSMIYAHARAGMFAPLLRGAVGQRVEVLEPDGRVLRYVIREYYPRWSSTDLKWLEPAGHEEMILETCTTYNVNDPRVIAVAEPE